MTKNSVLLFVLVFIAFLTLEVVPEVISQSSAATMDKHEIYAGMCDASGAVAVGASMFVVASDEDNILRLYRNDGSEHKLVQSFDLRPFLNLDAKHPEADIEAATRVGERIYWMTSHGTNKKGKLRRSRHKFFATEIRHRDDTVVFEFIGHPYERLIEDLSRSPKWQIFALAEAARRPPKSSGGLNIEALAAAPDGSLWIAFRNPIPDAKALLVRLKNPQAVVAGEAAHFGDPVLLSLHGLGIRGMEYSYVLGQYIIIAGSFDHHNAFKLYQWSGSQDQQPSLIQGLDVGDLNPESVIVYADGTLELLSDDGMHKVDGVACKKVRVGKRSFRSLRFALPAVSLSR